jgi:hypothetical protein
MGPGGWDSKLERGDYLLSYYLCGGLYIFLLYQMLVPSLCIYYFEPFPIQDFYLFLL